MYRLVLLSVLLACVAGVPLTPTKPKSDGRIVGGTETDITSHPYQVSLLYSGAHRCSGNIISANWVVTLAWCVDGIPISSLSVMSGSTYPLTGGNFHSVTSVIIHESYNPSALWDYDVALLQVSPDFTFSGSVQPIVLECVPVPAETEVVLTGWGGYTTVDIPLQQVTLQSISYSSCNTTLGGDITDRMICAGYPNGGKGGCDDYGSPLVANNTLVGIYSWGFGCGDPQYPDVNTKISAVCDWIVNNTGLYKVPALIN